MGKETDSPRQSLRDKKALGNTGELWAAFATSLGGEREQNGVRKHKRNLR